MVTISTLHNQGAVIAQPLGQIDTQSSLSSHSSDNKLANELVNALNNYIDNNSDRLKKLNKQLKTTLKGSSTQLTKFITIEKDESNKSKVVATKDFPNSYDRDNQAKILSALIKGHGSVASKNKSHLREAIKDLVQENPSLGLGWKRGGKIISGQNINDSSDILTPPLTRSTSESTNSEAVQENTDPKTPAQPLTTRGLRPETSNSAPLSTGATSANQQTIENSGPVGKYEVATSLLKRSLSLPALPAQTTHISTMEPDSAEVTTSTSDSSDSNLINSRKKYIEQVLTEYLKTSSVSQRKNEYGLSDKHLKATKQIADNLNKEFTALGMTANAKEKIVLIKGEFPRSKDDFMKLLNIIIGANDSLSKTQHKSHSSLVKLIKEIKNKDYSTSKIFEGIRLAPTHTNGLTGNQTLLFMKHSEETNDHASNNEVFGISNNLKPEAKLENSKKLSGQINEYNRKVKALNVAFQGGSLTGKIQNIAKRLNSLFPGKTDLSVYKEVSFKIPKPINIKNTDTEGSISTDKTKQYTNDLTSRNKELQNVKNKIEGFLLALTNTANNLKIQNKISSRSKIDIEQALINLESKATNHRQFFNTPEGENPSMYEKLKARFFSFVTNRSSWTETLHADKSDLRADLNAVKSLINDLNKSSNIGIDLTSLDQPSIHAAIAGRDLGRIWLNLKKDYTIFGFGYGLGISKAKRVAFERYVSHELGITKHELASLTTDKTRKGLAHWFSSKFSNATTGIKKRFS
jgi:hypothetical protein